MTQTQARPQNTAELRRGASSASLRKTIADAEARLPKLAEQLGRAVASGDDIAPQNIRTQIAELGRQISEANLALPYALAREAEYVERQGQIPVLEAQLKHILAGRARLKADHLQLLQATEEVLRAIRAYGRTNDHRAVRLQSELQSLGYELGLSGTVESTRGINELYALADRWDSEAGQVLDATPAPEQETNHAV